MFSSRVQWVVEGTFLYFLNKIEVHNMEPWRWSELFLRARACRPAQRTECCSSGNEMPHHRIFCLPGSFILREGEEHVTRRDQDPAGASRTLLQQTAGRHVSTCLLISFPSPHHSVHNWTRQWVLPLVLFLENWILVGVFSYFNECRLVLCACLFFFLLFFYRQVFLHGIHSLAFEARRKDMT